MMKGRQGMSIQVQAIFENGLLRPLQTTGLSEKQQVTITIDGESGGDPVRFVLPPDRWQIFSEALDSPPREIPALRKLLTEASVFDGKTDSAANSGAT